MDGCALIFILVDDSYRLYTLVTVDVLMMLSILLFTLLIYRIMDSGCIMFAFLFPLQPWFLNLIMLDGLFST